jgi:uncharacterized membrane protein
MQYRALCLCIVAAVSIVAGGPIYAFEASPAPAATPASGTHATRSAERKKRRAAMKVANKNGEIPINDEASAAPAATPASGTHVSRKADRHQIRATLADENKKGEIPRTNEAGQIK